MINNPYHLIFEGAELAGKSWLMSQVYDRLEPKYNKSKVILDGCHWFNCDVGIYGTEHGRPVIEHYLEIFRELHDHNLLIEKFHLSDIVYNRLHFKREVDYGEVEKILEDMDFKIIFVTFPEESGLLKKRIHDRLNVYPHYERILRDPEWYIAQQREYRREIKKSKLPVLTVETRTLPDYGQVDKILEWIGEK
jgi:hypothetical protein